MKDKFSLYLNALQRVVAKHGKEIDQVDRQLLKQNAFYGVKVVNGMDKAMSKEQAVKNFEFASIIKDVIAMLTLKEFMNVFPVAKEYDGDKYGVKDYFYTMDYINTLDQDEPIDDNILEVITEYHNLDILSFFVKTTLLMSDIREFEGHLNLLEEFMAEDGKDTENTFKNSKDEVFYIRNGRPEKLENQPRGLRVVK